MTIDEIKNKYCADESLVALRNSGQLGKFQKFASKEALKKSKARSKDFPSLEKMGNEPLKKIEAFANEAKKSIDRISFSGGNFIPDYVKKLALGAGVQIDKLLKGIEQAQKTRQNLNSGNFKK